MLARCVVYRESKKLIHRPLYICIFFKTLILIKHFHKTLFHIKKKSKARSRFYLFLNLWFNSTSMINLFLCGAFWLVNSNYLWLWLWKLYRIWVFRLTFYLYWILWKGLFNKLCTKINIKHLKKYYHLFNYWKGIHPYKID